MSEARKWLEKHLRHQELQQLDTLDIALGQRTGEDKAYFLAVLVYDTEALRDGLIRYLEETAPVPTQRAIAADHASMGQALEDIPTDQLLLIYPGEDFLQTPMALGTHLMVTRELITIGRKKVIYLFPKPSFEKLHDRGYDFFSVVHQLSEFSDFDLILHPPADAPLPAFDQSYEQRELQEAVQALQNTLTHHPDHLEAVWRRAFRVFDLADTLGELDLAYTAMQQTERLAKAQQNQAYLATCYGNQALILKAWGRLEEAFALHQKEQKLKEELGDKQGLARSYGNQAAIFQAWGRLEEAFALQEKAISLFEELGAKRELASLYGNQALILQDWGRLEEAFALHQKEQKLKEELGNKQGLATCYGNQAGILEAWGRLEEAFALHQKEQKLKEELGDQQGLATCYGNQALILQAWGRLEEAFALQEKAISLFEELGAKRELMIVYGNKAGILQVWSRWEEAVALRRRALEIGQQLPVSEAQLAILESNLEDAERGLTKATHSPSKGYSAGSSSE